MDSDSEDERVHGYQPVLAEQMKNSPSARQNSGGSWPRDGVNVYHNDLFKDGADGDVLGGPSGQDRAGGGALAASRPGTASRSMMQQKSSLAARRQERMQAQVIERNETLPRNLNSPGAPPQSPTLSRLAHASDTGVGSGRSQGPTGDMYNGLRLSYDPNEEQGGGSPAPPRGGQQQRYQAPSHLQPQQASLPVTPRLDLSDLGSFLRQPGPKAGPVLCYVVRDKGSAKMYPKYNLFLEDGKRFLLAARKRKKQTTSNYIISLDFEDLGRDSEKFFGKLRANFVGTDFTVYDNGDKTGKPATDGTVQMRQELGCVTYQYNVLGTRGPRKMTACIPAVDGSGRPLFRPLSDDDTLIDRVKTEKGLDDLVVMYNKPPRWNEELNAYCLNFNGRVTEASVKNFQLVTEDNEGYVILQFGKIGRNTFTLDYQWPMSALQAFAIALSSFDNKLACE